MLAQEFLIEELARRAFEVTAKSNRDMISYNDIGGPSHCSVVWAGKQGMHAHAALKEIERASCHTSAMTSIWLCSNRSGRVARSNLSAGHCAKEDALVRAHQALARHRAAAERYLCFPTPIY